MGIRIPDTPGARRHPASNHPVFLLLDAIHCLLSFVSALPSLYIFLLNDFPPSTKVSITMKFSIAAVAAVAGLAAASPSAPATNDVFALGKRASLPVPASKGSVTLKAPQEVSGTFDGGMKTYGRGVSCTGQVEGGNKDTVFMVKNGGTLKNVIIGKDQIEGIHCEGSCTIEVRRSISWPLTPS